MKKCFSFLLALTLMLAVCAAASAETITLKIAHNYDFVTIPNSVIAAADRLNERYAAEGKDIKIEFETDYQRIDWGEYGQNLIFAYKNGDCPDIFSVSDVPDHGGCRHAARPERPESGRFCRRRGSLRSPWMACRMPCRLTCRFALSTTISRCW